MSCGSIVPFRSRFANAASMNVPEFVVLKRIQQKQANDLERKQHELDQHKEMYGGEDVYQLKDPDPDNPDQSPKAVTQRIQRQYRAFIRDNPDALVAFTAHWCGHCQTMAPEYEKAAKELKQRKASKSKMAAVDCAVYGDFCAANQVNGYPTVFSYNKGNKSTYQGQRTAKDFVQNMELKNKAPNRKSGNSNNIRRGGSTKGRKIRIRIKRRKSTIKQ